MKLRKHWVSSVNILKGIKHKVSEMLTRLILSSQPQIFFFGTKGKQTNLKGLQMSNQGKTCDFSQFKAKFWLVIP